MRLKVLMSMATIIDRFSQLAYRRITRAILRSNGVRVDGLPLWVSSRVYWDLSAPIHLGDRCVVSHYVRFLTHDFSLDRAAERAYGISARELSRRAPISIGSQAFIGMGAVILPGVTIGDGAIIGAGSVVTKDVEADTVIAGNPAREISTNVAYLAKREADFTWGERR